MAGRPLPLTIACWIAIVAGALKCIGIPVAFAQVWSDASAPQPEALQYALAAFAIVVSVAQIVGGLRTLRQRPSAYRLLVLACILGAMLGALQSIGGSLAPLVFVALNLVVVALLLRPESKAWVTTPQST